MTLILLTLTTNGSAGTIMGADPETGKPFHWNGPVALKVDTGSLGLMTNAEARELLLDAVLNWNGVETSSLEIQLTDDVLPVEGPEGKGDVATLQDFNAMLARRESSVVFDTDGAIAADMGLPESVVAIGGFTPPTSGSIISHGYSLINGLALENQTTRTVTRVLTHELGHLIGLAHTAVGQERWLRDDAGIVSGPDGEPLGAWAPDQVAMMFWILIADTPVVDHIDDISILSTVYPSAERPLSQFGSITGRLLDIDGQTPRTGGWIIARNLDGDPLRDAVSVISGDRLGADIEDHPLRGAFEIHGLDPDARWSLEVRATHTNGAYRTPVFTSDGSSASPNAGPMPGPEEYYSGPDESHLAAQDDATTTPFVIELSPGGPEQPYVADIALNGSRIAGIVRDESGAPLAGARIHASGTAQSAQTDATGYYEIGVPNHWTGAVTATVAGYRLEPTSHDFLNFEGFSSGNDFTATPTDEAVVIAGRALRGGVIPIAGVTITFDGDTVQSAVTDRNGQYQITVPYNASGVATAVYPDIFFEPAARMYEGLQSDRINEHFTVSADQFADAVSIVGLSGSVAGSNIHATKEPGEPKHVDYDEGGKSIWWKWTAPRSGEFYFNNHGSDFDTVLAIYIGNSVDNLRLLESNDDDGWEDSLGIPYVSGMIVRVQAGIDYHIVVEGFLGSADEVSAGPILLNWGPAEHVAYGYDHTREAFSTIDLDTGKILLPGYPSRYTYFSTYRGGDFPPDNPARFYAYDDRYHSLDAVNAGDPLIQTPRFSTTISGLSYHGYEVVDMSWSAPRGGLLVLARHREDADLYIVGDLDPESGDFTTGTTFRVQYKTLLNLAADPVHPNRFASYVYNRYGPSMSLEHYAIDPTTTSGIALIHTAGDGEATPFPTPVPMPTPTCFPAPPDFLPPPPPEWSPMDYDPATGDFYCLFNYFPDLESAHCYQYNNTDPKPQILRLDSETGEIVSQVSIEFSDHRFSAFAIVPSSFDVEPTPVIPPTPSPWIDDYTLDIRPKATSHTISLEGLVIDNPGRAVTVKIKVRPEIESPRTIPEIHLQGAAKKIYLDRANVSALTVEGNLKALTAKNGYVSQSAAERFRSVKMTALANTTDLGEVAVADIRTTQPTPEGAEYGKGFSKANIRLSGLFLRNLDLYDQRLDLLVESKKYEYIENYEAVSRAGIGSGLLDLTDEPDQSRLVASEIRRIKVSGADIGTGTISNRILEGVALKVIGQGVAYSLDQGDGPQTFDIRPANIAPHTLQSVFTLEAKTRMGDLAPRQILSNVGIQLLQARLGKVRLARKSAPLIVGGRVGLRPGDALDPEESWSLFVNANGFFRKNESAPNIRKVHGDLGIRGRFYAGAGGYTNGSYMPNYNSFIGALSTLTAKKAQKVTADPTMDPPMIQGDIHIRGGRPKLKGDTDAIESGDLVVHY